MSERIGPYFLVSVFLELIADCRLRCTWISASWAASKIELWRWAAFYSTHESPMKWLFVLRCSAFTRAAKPIPVQNNPLALIALFEFVLFGFFSPESIIWWFSTVDVIETWGLSSSVQHWRSPGDVSVFFRHPLVRMSFIVFALFLFCFSCSVFVVTVSIRVGIQWDLLFGIEGFRMISCW